jgi:hypothetical protein
MVCAKIMEFRMPRPKIVRTAQEAAAVPRNLPVQVELPSPDLVIETELFLAENELVLAEQLVVAKKRVVELLRQAAWSSQ